MRDETRAMRCKAWQGDLPACAPLANPYVPFQPYESPMYGANKGLARGTLFESLDLPFMNMVNEEKKDPTPLNELQALGFAVQELGEYLDTHRDDREAADLMAQYVSLYQQGMEKYQQACGPLKQTAAVQDGMWRWLSDPWPWEYVQKED